MGERFDVGSAITEVRSQVLLSVAEAAINMGCTEERLHRIIEQKGLPVVRFGKYVYLNRADLRALSRAKPPLQEVPRATNELKKTNLHNLF